MLASTGRWPNIYGQIEQPSNAMLSSLVVNNRGNLVIGGDIASEGERQNHRGPLVWLCHEVRNPRVADDWLCILKKNHFLQVFGERYTESGTAILGVGEDGQQRSCETKLCKTLTRARTL